MRYLLTTTLLLIFAAAGTGLAAQQTFTVTSLSDSGPGSLRQAITDANTANGNDTIEFSITGVISLQAALPVIDEKLTIEGPGRNLLTIERDSAAASDFRIFETEVGVELIVRRLTIQGGRAEDGGAFYTRGFTTLNDVLVQDCIASGSDQAGGPGTDGRGGAIYHTDIIGGFSIYNSLITGCHAQGGEGGNGNGGNAYGGAIYVNSGGLNLFSTTVENCTAVGGDSTGGDGDAGEAIGGGIYASFLAYLADCQVNTCSATSGQPNGTGSGAGSHGGGLYGEGAITSTDTTWDGNSCQASTLVGFARGGAVHFAPSGSQQMLLTRSVFTGNSATSGTSTGISTGAIHSTGAFTLRESEVANTTATSSGSNPAMAVWHVSSSTCIVERSAIHSGNSGGIAITSSTTANMYNTTVSGNSGGGVWEAAASLGIAFCTIVDNTNTSGGGGLEVTTGAVTVRGSIMAGNTGSSAAAADYAVATGTLTDQGGNVIGIEDGSVFTHADTQTGDSTAPLDPVLGPLTDNGGLTPTHALLTGSPAIDEGGSVGVPSEDQRNAPRNVGPADAGSYEFGAQVPGNQGNAGGEGDDRCSTSDSAGLSLIMLLGLLALAGLCVRARGTTS